MHHATNAEIELTESDAARGLWSLNFRTILLENSSVTHLVVEYEDVYRRADGRWRIAETASRITTFLSEQIDAGGFAHYTALGLGTCRARGDPLIYRPTALSKQMHQAGDGRLNGQRRYMRKPRPVLTF